MWQACSMSQSDAILMLCAVLGLYSAYERRAYAVQYGPMARLVVLLMAAAFAVPGSGHWREWLYMFGMMIGLYKIAQVIGEAGWLAIQGQSQP